MLHVYIKEHILSFVDYHTIIKLISVPTVYRYLLRLVKYIRYPDDLPVIAQLEKYYHFNGYNGLSVSDIKMFTRGHRLPGNNVNTSLARQLWILKSQYHRIYGPALTYRINGTICKCVWYYEDKIHRANYPAVTRYYDDGSVCAELYYRYDVPHSYDGKPTAIFYTLEGFVSELYWHDSKGRILKMIAY
jgi:hypothetical protein